jgi:hypothetical protein
MAEREYPEWKKVGPELRRLFGKLKAVERIVDYKDITQAELKKTLSDNPVAGVYLFFDEKGNPLYVGRTKNLQRRLGVDHRLSVANRAALAVRLYKDRSNRFRSLNAARRYIIDNCKVAWVDVGNPYYRALFEIYASIKTRAKHNFFEEH